MRFEHKLDDLPEHEDVRFAQMYRREQQLTTTKDVARHRLGFVDHLLLVR